ncbi:MAG: zinc ABC transporter substrate-binding protein [Gemmatales bacterium]|nr:zinc ABC transporter substrate-binding protein [Gemmatales bacterium]MDW8386987.1 zinc ABC transporter substrate-binding protein [Gemmatales bacterium]
MAIQLLHGRRGFAGALVVLSLAGAVIGCGRYVSSKPAPNGAEIVATTGLVADLARRVSGGLVEVEAIMGPGVDPHLYQAKAADRRKLENAKLVLYNGLHLEGTMSEMLQNLPHARAVAEGIAKHQLLYAEGQPDPHVWFDVKLWIQALGAVEAAMCDAFPQHADAFRKNAADYRTELQALDEEIRRALATIPPQRRVLITAHDAFRYFGRAYGIEVIGLQGISTADETGLKEMQRIVERVVRDRIPAIFAETSVPMDGVQAVVERCHARGHEVRIAKAKLYSDALDRPDVPEGSYPGMMRHNVQVIVDELRAER